MGRTDLPVPGQAEMLADGSRSELAADPLPDRLSRLDSRLPQAADYLHGKSRFADQPYDQDQPLRLTDEEHAAHAAEVRDGLADARAAGLETDQQITVDAGKRIWADERSALHREIVADLYAKASGVPCDGMAVLAGGLPGAGKTTVLSGPAGIDRSQYLTINPDEIKEVLAARDMVPYVAGLSPMEASDLVHKECSDIARRLAMRAYADGKNVIWDITMSSEASTERRVRDLRDAGYSYIEGIFVDIPVDVSIRRADARHREGNEEYRAGRGLGERCVPADRIQAQADPDFGSTCRRAFERVQGKLDRWRVYDNSVDGQAAVLVGEGGPGSTDEVRK